MSKHQEDNDAQELWTYWQSVFNWVRVIFPNQDAARARLMRDLPWGVFYNAHKYDVLNAQKLETEIVRLLDDDEVGVKKGIYQFLLEGQDRSAERYLSLRVFDDKMKQQKYSEQKGMCPMCGKHFEFDQMDGDHITAWSKGGRTVIENCQMLCKPCNLLKSNK